MRAQEFAAELYRSGWLGDYYRGDPGRSNGDNGTTGTGDEARADGALDWLNRPAAEVLT